MRSWACLLLSVVEGRRRPVLLVGDVGAPRRAGALIVDLEQREVRHEARPRGAVPVVLARLEEHAVAGADHLDRAAAALREADTLGDPDGLGVRVRVQGRACDGGRVTAAPA